MTQPSRLLEKLAHRCFPTDTAESAAFLEAMSAPQERTSALVWLASRPRELPFSTHPRLSWQADFVDRVAADSRPGQHELHDAGAFYIMDFSSIFAATATRTVADLLGRPPDRIIDVCSAPGGKAIFAFRALAPEQLICNEVIRKRCKALISNLTRCQLPRTAVVSVDPSRLAEACALSADLAVVDAPCSGQSLLVKGKPVPGCFHPRTIAMNLKRQRRILAETRGAVTPGGFIAYMTCTYSPEENEEVVDWFLDRFPEFTAAEVPLLNDFRSPLSNTPTYRLWPQSGLGAGAFVALLHKQGATPGRDAGERSVPQLPELHTLWVSRNG